MMEKTYADGYQEGFDIGVIMGRMDVHLEDIKKNLEKMSEKCNEIKAVVLR